ncbi:MAG: hypothetical protein EPN41_13410 [Candidimonas sp.]|nr:MAG: hypothetical protein EPN41_13410 [Candidimonas sp.]
MIPNILNTLVGLVLSYATVLHPTWVERQYGPFLVFAVIMLVLSIWARVGDAYHWFGNVNIACSIIIGVVSLLPLGTMPDVAFWTGMWMGILIPCVALWAALYNREPSAHQSKTAGS